MEKKRILAEAETLRELLKVVKSANNYGYEMASKVSKRSYEDGGGYIVMMAKVVDNA